MLKSNAGVVVLSLLLILLLPQPSSTRALIFDLNGQEDFCFSHVGFTDSLYEQMSLLSGSDLTEKNNQTPSQVFVEYSTLDYQGKSGLHFSVIQDDSVIHSQNTDSYRFNFRAIQNKNYYICFKNLKKNEMKTVSVSIENSPYPKFEEFDKFGYKILGSSKDVVNSLSKIGSMSKHLEENQKKTLE
ncbi:MAG: hypothetical protein MHPSP_003583, partial [Paramarteilia canceri]